VEVFDEVRMRENFKSGFAANDSNFPNRLSEKSDSSLIGKLIAMLRANQQGKHDEHDEYFGGLQNERGN
jgi:hypothetical protein